jgi:hypothetical protein
MIPNIHNALKDLAWHKGEEGWRHRTGISHYHVKHFLQGMVFDGLVEQKIKKYNQYYYRITFKGLWTLYSVFGKY